MSVGSPILFLAATWCIIHILHHLLTSKSTSSLLPTSSSASDSRRPLFSGTSHHTKVSLHSLHLRISTTKWNSAHDKLAAFLAKRGNQRISTLCRGLYNLGSLLGALGMLMAVIALLWMCSNSAWTLFRKVNTGTVDHTPDIVRRAVEDAPDFRGTSNPDASSRFSGITPIIPGVTVPLSHLPIIITAVFLSQVIHELGHAVAAAREALPMLAAGASFTVSIPAAFVTFPVAGTNGLTPQARSRVIAAGPFHNLLLWCLLVSITRLGVINIAGAISGYKNISDIGKVVIDVNADSPLYLHLTPGSVITKLDDTSLSQSMTSNDVWTDYLTGVHDKPSLGWCVGRNSLEKSDSCCVSSSTKASPFVCFASMDHSERGCIDPLPVLTKPSDHGRCSSAGDCSPESVCVLPVQHSQLMRLTVRPSASQLDDDTVVLWSGPRREVWDEVQVGNWYPRVWFLPLWFPPLLQGFWEYLTMATLSLYFFNLLPLPYLDGTELLRSFLDLAFDVKQESFMFDIESLENGEIQETTRTRWRWKERILRFVKYGLVGALICYILLAVMNSLD